MANGMKSSTTKGGGPIDTFGERLHSLFGSQSAGDQGAGSSQALTLRKSTPVAQTWRPARAEPEHEEFPRRCKDGRPVQFR